MSQPSRLAAARFGLAAGLVSAASMLLLSIADRLGVYESAVRAMQDWHVFYDPSVLGTLAGMLEAFVVGFIFAWTLAWTYNRLPPMRRAA